ncbi:MAG: precorrin-8X methylmutase [Clostridiales bacterium]
MEYINNPQEIESRSFAIIRENLEHPPLNEKELAVLTRVIHTSADFDYQKNLVFSPDAIDSAIQALKEGCGLITDTQMALSGINKKNLALLNSHVSCYIHDPEVAKKSKEIGCTRAKLSMEKAAEDPKNRIFIIGNAPTALLALDDLLKKTDFRPALIIGVPVGFVNVVESKEVIVKNDIPFIVAHGRKGGSNVGAAIVNALMLLALKEKDL